MKDTHFRLSVLFFLILLGLVIPQKGAAQGKKAGYNISLTVISEADEQPVIGATCQMTDYGIYAVTDLDGLATLEKVPAGKATLLVQLLGYEDFKQEISVTRDTTIAVALQESSLMLEQVVVTATASAVGASSASAGKYQRSPSFGHIVARGFGVRCMADEFDYSN